MNTLHVLVILLLLAICAQGAWIDPMVMEYPPAREQAKIAKNSLGKPEWFPTNNVNVAGVTVFRVKF